MASLSSAMSRTKKLDAKLRPSAADEIARISRLSDQELELELTANMTAAVGPLDAFETFEAAREAIDRVLDRDFHEATTRDLWERARWFRHHAGHASFQFGPRWAHPPLLSCVCGGHLKVYRGLIPAVLWPKITEDDRSRGSSYPHRRRRGAQAG